MTCLTCHDTRQYCRGCERASDACRCEETGCSATDAQELEPCEECPPRRGGDAAWRLGLRIAD